MIPDCPVCGTKLNPFIDKGICLCILDKLTHKVEYHDDADWKVQSFLLDREIISRSDKPDCCIIREIITYNDNLLRKFKGSIEIPIVKFSDSYLNKYCKLIAFS